MNPPSPQPTPSSHSAAGELQILNWLRLRRELAELNARLEYLKLMASLRMSK